MTGKSVGEDLYERLLRTECPAFEERRRQRQAGDTPDQPIVVRSGAGSRVTDVDGREYVDFVCGFGALVLGHGHPALVEALADQNARLWMAMGDVYSCEEKIYLLERLVKLIAEPNARAILGSSGADAVTAALKTAELTTGKPGIIAFEGAYHGLSHGPLAACGFQPGFRQPFAQSLSQHVQFARYPDHENDLEEALRTVRQLLQGGSCGGVLVEPILGRGGVVVPPDPFLSSLRSLCDEHDALLIVDEIWTGMMRCGEWLASPPVLPDIVCVGKALGGGFPISACVGRASAMAAWGKHGGTAIHTATHAGNALGVRAALATWDVLANEHMGPRAVAIGANWVRDLSSRGFHARGRGLAVGVEFETAATALRVMRDLKSRGFLVLTGGEIGNVLTLTPPLNVAKEDLDAFTDALVVASRLN